MIPIQTGRMSNILKDLNEFVKVDIFNSGGNGWIDSYDGTFSIEFCIPFLFFALYTRRKLFVVLLIPFYWDKSKHAELE